MNRRVLVPVLGAGAVVLVVGLAIGGAVLSGNGSSSGSSDSAAVGVADAPNAVAPSAAAGATGAAGAADVPGAASAPGTDDLGQAGQVAGRDVVRTAQLAVTADDPSGAADRAAGIASAAGGRVDQDTRDGSAHLVLRVPGSTLETTLGRLAALGHETSRQVQGDDVTTQTADLDARVQALQTSVTRLQTLLSNSGSLGDLLSVETQLTQRQADLESLQAQQKALADQVALATVTLDLTTPAAVAAAAGPTGFGGALAGGWHGFTVAVRYLLAALGYALPFLLLAAAALVAVVVVRRRRAGRGAPPPAPDPASS